MPTPSRNATASVLLARLSAPTQQAPAAPQSLTVPGAGPGTFPLPFGTMSQGALQQYDWLAGSRVGAPPLPRDPAAFLTGAFGPSVPMPPFPIDVAEDGQRPDPRRFEYPVGFNLPSLPGSEGLKLASFSNLRAYADVYSVARACLNVRENEVLGVDWDIVPTEDAAAAMRNDSKKAEDFQKRVREVISFFDKPDDNYRSYHEWLRAILEDVFVIDALALHVQPPRLRGMGVLNSNLARLNLIDGSTVKPLLDLHGATPRPPNPAFAVFGYGVPRRELMDLINGNDLDLTDDVVKTYRADQLMYLRYQPRSHSPYGISLIEQCIIPIAIGLKGQQYTLQYYTEGSVPDTFVVDGRQSSTAQQNLQLQNMLNATAGDTAYRRKIIVLPFGGRPVQMKPQALTSGMAQEYAEYVCMVIDVSPHEIGLTPQKSGGLGGKGFADQQANAQSRKSFKPFLWWLKRELFDTVIQRILGQADMEWHWKGFEQPEDQEKTVATLIQQRNAGTMSTDEVRIAQGLDPFGTHITSAPQYFTGSGIVSLEDGKVIAISGGGAAPGPDQAGPQSGQEQEPKEPNETPLHDAAASIDQSQPVKTITTSDHVKVDFYRDADGTIHPIAGSEGYSEARTTAGREQQAKESDSLHSPYHGGAERTLMLQAHGTHAERVESLHKHVDDHQVALLLRQHAGESPNDKLTTANRLEESATKENSYRNTTNYGKDVVGGKPLTAATAAHAADMLRVEAHAQGAELAPHVSAKNVLDREAIAQDVARSAAADSIGPAGGEHAGERDQAKNAIDAYAMGGKYDASRPGVAVGVEQYGKNLTAQAHDLGTTTGHAATGDTYKAKESLKRGGWKFSGEHRSWISAEPRSVPAGIGTKPIIMTHAERALTGVGQSAGTKKVAIPQQLSSSEHTGVMVALIPPESIAQQIAIPDGEQPDELHVTLAYLGDTVTLPQHQLELLPSLVASFAVREVPVQAELTGSGEFAPGDASEGKVPYVALVSGAGLQDMRARLVAYLRQAGFVIGQPDQMTSVKDVYLPHMTLDYLDQNEPLPRWEHGHVPVTFTTIRVAVGGDVCDFALTGSAEGIDDRNLPIPPSVPVGGIHTLSGKESRQDNQPHHTAPRWRRRRSGRVDVQEQTDRSEHAYALDSSIKQIATLTDGQTAVLRTWLEDAGAWKKIATDSSTARLLETVLDGTPNFIGRVYHGLLIKTTDIDAWLDSAVVTLNETTSATKRKDSVLSALMIDASRIDRDQSVSVLLSIDQFSGADLTDYVQKFSRSYDSIAEPEIALRQGVRYTIGANHREQYNGQDIVVVSLVEIR